MTDETPHILVTGGARGIGAAIRDALTARGARALAHGRKAREGVIAEDLAEPGAADRLWDAALAGLDGRIDVLINNAAVFEGVAVDAPADAWRASWTRTTQVNLHAAADLSRRAVLHFKQRGAPGRIVNISSRAAHRGDSPEHWHYAASKAGLVAMTKTIARAYAAEGILAFAICPGFVMTGMAEDYLASRGGAGVLADIPLGRVAEPAEVARIAAFLALDAPAAMTGAILDINGASYVR
jgi:NAD(P)-dependent dehydrogenase (short-subunit alcohol dehydrogenase family)